MPKVVRRSDLFTWTDLFCGAGGSSSGIESVPGNTVRMACNHWDLAIETHNHNMPHVDHDVADIAEIDPRRYPTTDGLWASPSCTFWSQARGEKQDFAGQETDPTLFDLALGDDAEDEAPLANEARERSRALMHDVPRFAEYHRYKTVIVENVPPLLKWVHFGKWVSRMRALGYLHQVLTLNSAFAHQLGAPAPQLRDRVYVAFWQERYRRPDFERWTRPKAWCPTCGETVTAMRAAPNPNKPSNLQGSYGRQYIYRCPRISCRNATVQPYVLPALAAIDMQNPGKRIGDRDRPLKPKTLARIEAGLRRYVPRSIVLEAAGNTFERRPGVRTWPIDEPLRTVHATASKAIAQPPMMAATSLGLSELAEHEQHAALRAMLSSRRHCTGTGDGGTPRERGLLVPSGGTWNTDARPTSEPMRTRTTRETEGLVLLPLRTNERAAGKAVTPRESAMGERHDGLLMRNNTGGAEMCTPLDEPARTLTTAGHQSLLSWSPDVLYAYDTGGMRSSSAPMPTQTAVEGDAVLESQVDVEDCRFRMLTPDEVKLGMAFAAGFVLLGTNNGNKVRMCGNAVTPPVSRDLAACVVEAVTEDLIDRPTAL
ncbi:DNA cytosine methyltransferase [Pseudonocardia sp. WMMC193]|uniref:DNA cytosine methyltransferase n=1 Tax=Pseudonocardia sp. WMMC193 TaxID=2911965 RepID=UPI001F016510|nr:DNA cytosine methyltransferase [Pseudonocardia sp. WMMC193]MCF7547214.1 DNA cytosine methyltransferase [Pseudonocardia sp. WMMC193]